MTMITIHAALPCEFGQSPAEITVDAMIKDLNSYAENKKLSKLLAERQYWDNISNSDDMAFAIFRDYEK